MTNMSRRKILQIGAGGSLVFLNSLQRMLAADQKPVRKFTLDLRCSSIGVAVNQAAAIDLAHRFQFESVAADPTYLAELTNDSMAQLLGGMQEKKIVWGAADLGVEFRQDERAFKHGIEVLPRLASGLQRAGVTRVGTWLSPAHNDLTYTANFRQHKKRLATIANILRDHGLRIGLEYVGPKTSWTSKRYSFIHTMAETQELIGEIGVDNVGLVLDSWHWYTAQESVEAILALKNSQVIACDLNDAPAGLAVDQQIDNRRELPAATGVINVKEFLSALIHIGYDGPVRAEPFNKVVNEMADEAAVAATKDAMQNAFAKIDYR